MAEPTKHQGSCHCGAVRFEVPIDATAGTRCNCSICQKTNVTGQRAQPGSLTVTKGRDDLSGYKTASGTRYFCKHCGVQLYGEGYVAEIGGAFLSVNLNALDDVDHSEIKVAYWDGRHDNWQAGTRDAPWPTR